MAETEFVITLDGHLVTTYQARYWQILLQKSFCTADQKFSGL
jgi:hypothetical protein